MNRRAFALPMAVMLVLLGGILVAMMLQRHTAQLLTNQRQLESYQLAHATRGISEAIDAWVRSNGSNAIADALDLEGKAFDLTTEGGEVLHIYLADGQGLALGDLAGLSGDTLDAGREIIRQLVENERGLAARFVRKDGPLAVSVNTAPAEVLRAVAQAAGAGKAATAVAGDIAGARGGGLLDTASLQRLIAECPAPEESKPRLMSLLTATPAVWRVEAALERRATGQDLARYRAWALITRTATVAAGDRNSSIDRPVSIFGWERVDEADPSRANPGPRR